MPQAVKTLFQIMTTEGWTEIMSVASDSTKIN